MDPGTAKISKALLDVARVAEVELHQTEKGRRALAEKRLDGDDFNLLERIDGVRSVEHLLAISDDVVNVHSVLGKLLAAGFTKDQINVACTNETFNQHFLEYRNDRTGGSISNGEVASGAALGATVGGVAAISLGIASGAVLLVIAGAAGIAGGSTMGGFLGAMFSKEVENDFSNLYHDELQQGKILVAVIDKSPEGSSNLAKAAAIFNETGSEVLARV